MNLRKYIFVSFLLLAVLFIYTACGGGNKTSKQKTNISQIVKAPEFNGDSAYYYIKQQVDFGPRVPNTSPHKACGDYLANQLKAFGAQVTEQIAIVNAFDGTALNMRNIIGSYNLDSRKRVMLCAHWDSRPWADNDPDETNYHTPILGANDGASGIGVLLEIARQIQLKQPSIGIDLIFFDAEDYGTPQFIPDNHDESYWCLGSQYWSRTPHVPGYNARFGILLDMVGGADATFFQEGFSREYASAVVNKVWDKAHEIGFGKFFPKEKGSYITDDHVPVNRIARIPCIDIVPMYPNCEQSNFGPTWHTINDNMENIDRNTLKAVGQTVMEVIYNEK